MSQHSRERGGHRRPVRWVFRAALVALAVSAAGCAGTGATDRQDAGDGASGRMPVLLRTADLRLPLDDYIPSLADAGRLARAGRLLVRRCMGELGFGDYAASEPAPTAGPRTWNERRYGLADPAQAAHGYWSASRTAAAVRRVPTVATAEEGDAVTGRARVVNGRPVPAGGCGSEAQRRLTAHDPPGADRYLAQHLITDSFFGSQRDSRVRAVTAEWAGCMRVAGYSYAAPLDPPRDQRFQGAVTALEVAVAEADIACKRQTNLVGVWFTVESAQQRSLIEANRPALELAGTAFRAELAVAAGVGA
jgi:hypothetical protein